MRVAVQPTAKAPRGDNNSDDPTEVSKLTGTRCKPRPRFFRETQIALRTLDRAFGRHGSIDVIVPPSGARYSFPRLGIPR